MNTRGVRGLRWMAGVGGWLTSVATALGFTSATLTEFHLSADLDGDSRADAVIVDRVSGSFRVGYQLAPGVLTWADARAAGLENLTAVTAGRLVNLGRDALAFASPEGNRVNVLEAPAAATPASPQPVFVPGVGAGTIVAFELAGAGNTPHADLYVASQWNNLPSPNRLSLVRSTGGAFTPLTDVAAATLSTAANLARLTAGTDVLGVIESVGGVHNFRTYLGVNNALAPVAGIDGVPGDGWLFGNFTGGALHHFLFFAPSNSTLVVHPATGPAVFGPGKAYQLGFPIGEVFALPVVNPGRLLILSANGTAAHLYDFDGNTLTPRQTLDADAGEAFTGASILSDGSFKLYSGDVGIGQSTRIADVHFDGAKYVKGPTSALPAVDALSVHANVFFFDREPFANPGPALVRSASLPDWTGAVILGGNPKQALVGVEKFGTSAQGLDNPAAVALGGLPANANFALGNQYREMVSLLSFQPAIGDEAIDVAIQPPPGVQPAAFELRFSAIPAVADIFYRINNAGVWKTYNSANPDSIFSDAVVHYYARLGGSEVKSRIQRAEYFFAAAAGDQDSDGDGVPDYVELGATLPGNKHLDPNGGADSDGDGFDDRTELLLGTDPLNKDTNVVNAVPKKSQRLESGNAFDLALSPRPLDPLTVQVTSAAEGTLIEAHRLHGPLVGRETNRVLNLAGVPDPAVRFQNLFVQPGERLMVLASEPHFRIATANADKAVGRELLAVVPVPAYTTPLVNYTYGGGSLATEAQNWLNAAKAAQAAVPHPLLKGSFGPADTLVALLVERKINELLVSRAVAGFSPSNLTLFPFRARDAGRLAATSEQLAALAQRLDDTHPGFDLAVLHSSVAAAILPPGAPAHDGLRLLATEVYRISAAKNNAEPGEYELPPEVLRGFVLNGSLPDNYAALVVLNPAQRAAAFTAAQGLLNGLPARPVATFDLVVTPTSFTGDCTTLEVKGSGVKKNLFGLAGQPFNFPDGFLLLPGSEVRVFGYTDLNVGGCPGDDLEVLSAELIVVPPPSYADVNGNLLPDDWECLFLAGSGNGGDDADGDGNSNLQELLDGTDPKDPNSKSAVKVDLNPPKLAIELKPDGQVNLKFTFPKEYAAKFKFALESTESLENSFGPGVLLNPSPDGSYALLLPAVQKVQMFVRLSQQLVR